MNRLSKKYFCICIAAVFLAASYKVFAAEETNKFEPNSDPVSGKVITYTFTGINQNKYYNEIQNDLPSTAKDGTVVTLPNAIGYLGTNTLFYDDTKKYLAPPYKIRSTAPYPGTFTARIYIDRYVSFNNQWLLFNRAYEDYKIIVRGTVVFNNNGGKTKVADRYYAKNEKFGTLPPSPKKKGFKFKGWYTKPEKGQKILKDTTVTFGYNTKKTVYAHWEKTVTVKYKLNGAKLNKKYSRKKLVKVGSKYGKLPKPKKKNYYFRGWFLGNKKVTSKSYVNTLKNHTLTAKWLKKGKGKTITKQEYSRIKKGMTYADVKAIVGGKGSLYKRWTDQNSSYSLYKWNGVMYNKNGANAMIGFKKNKVITKSKYRL